MPSIGLAAGATLRPSPQKFRKFLCVPCRCVPLFRKPYPYSGDALPQKFREVSRSFCGPCRERIGSARRREERASAYVNVKCRRPSERGTLSSMRQSAERSTRRRLGSPASDADTCRHGHCPPFTLQGHACPHDRNVCCAVLCCAAGAGPAAMGPSRISAQDLKHICLGRIQRGHGTG